MTTMGLNGDGLVVGIDASRNRSGGGVVHLCGILEEFDPAQHGVREVHVWSFDRLLDQLTDRPWLKKHNPAALQKSLLHQVWWQYRWLPIEARRYGCHVMLNTDAGTVCRFRPAVTMSRDMLPYDPREMSRYGLTLSRLRFVILRFLHTSSLRRAEGAIFLTRHAAERIQEFTGRLPVARVIPHGVSEKFRQVTAGGKWQEGMPIRCLYVSNAELYKHQWEVIRAAGALRSRGFDVELLLVGGGRGRAQQLLDEAIAAIDPRHAFTETRGFARHDDIPALLRDADLFIFASSCENMPNTLVEAMASGLPIACSNRGPMPEVLQDGGSYFDPEDAQSIADAVERIIVDAAYRTGIAKRAKELSKQFSWTTCASMTFSFLVECSNHKSPMQAQPVMSKAAESQPVEHRGVSPHPYQICTRCIMDTSDTSIAFNDAGLCDYCVNFDTNIRPNWHDDERGAKRLANIAEKIRQDGKKRSFDCIIGVSGGLDSSYAALTIKRLGLRPLLFHVDGGWNTDRAVGNIEKLVNGLGLDLYTEVIDWEEMKDLQLAVLRSQIPQQDIPQDTAFFSALYAFARKQKIKYSVTGGNYSTECCREPDEWGAFPGVDKRLILDIHRRFGTIPLKQFPIVDVFESKVYHHYVLGMRVFKPLDLIRYIKAEAEEELGRLFGWQPFRHKHHESRLTRFLEDYWFPRKFGFDRRRAHFSSLIMTGQMGRGDALARIAEPEFDEHFLEQEFSYVANKLEISVNELRQIFEGENRHMSNYHNKLRLIGAAGKVMVTLGLERRLYK